jgi:hypothetical protein
MPKMRTMAAESADDDDDGVLMVVLKVLRRMLMIQPRDVCGDAHAAGNASVCLKET